MRETILGMTDHQKAAASNLMLCSQSIREHSHKDEDRRAAAESLEARAEMARQRRKIKDAGIAVSRNQRREFRMQEIKALFESLKKRELSVNYVIASIDLESTTTTRKYLDELVLRGTLKKRRNENRHSALCPLFFYWMD
jgi:hypothetical protein